MALSKKTSLFLKVAISLILLGVILWKIDPREAFRAALQIDRRMLAACVVLVFLDRVLNWTRMYALLSARKRDFTFFSLAKLYWMSDFAAIFMPGSVSVDALRVYMLSRKHTVLDQAFSGVVMERLMSTAALASLAFIGACVGLGSHAISVRQFWAIAAFFLIFLIGVWMFFLLGPRFVGHRFFSARPLTIKLRSLIESVIEFRRHKGLLTLAYAASLAIQLLRVAVTAVLAAGLGVHVDLFYYFILIPVSTLMIMLPVSISGLGVQEGTYVLLLTTAGAPASKAFALSMINTIVPILVALPGLFIYLKYGAAWKKAAPAAAANPAIEESRA